jgi:hypothetical protein
VAISCIGVDATWSAGTCSSSSSTSSSTQQGKQQPKYPTEPCCDHQLHRSGRNLVSWHLQQQQQQQQGDFAGVRLPALQMLPSQKLLLISIAASNCVHFPGALLCPRL